jgi:hypothetical protein
LLWVAVSCAVVGYAVKGVLPDDEGGNGAPDPSSDGLYDPEPSGEPHRPSYDSGREESLEGDSRSASAPPAAGNPTSVRQGQYFRYAVPGGWQVMEDGQFAVVLMAPDRSAITTMVGNVGLPSNYSPAQYVFEKLSQAGLSDLRLGDGRAASPAFGFPSAWEFDVAYSVGGAACRGLARCSVAPNYDFCTMVMTWAAAEASQWPAYATWLPDLAAQAQVTNSAAFGASGIAQQNLQNSIALGEQARRNREYSAEQWADVTRQRGASQDRNHADFREAMGAVQSYYDPYENRAVELPSSNTVYWVHSTSGRIVGDPNPSFDPRTSTDADWKPLRRTGDEERSGTRN